ncbi:MAG: hypothetical protein LBQ01_06115 [Prevotellaceae bacterium]|jgi:hypothetical protein|nr:hypothetical protein [Prevotellaceae bacterium]
MENDLNSGFEKLVRDKLEDYKIPVPQGAWDIIEKSLIRKKRSKYLYAAAGIVAAAAVLFMITLYLSRNTDSDSNNRPNITHSDDASPAIQPKNTEQPAGETAKQEEQTPENQPEQKQPVSNPAPVHAGAGNSVAVRTEKPDPHPEDPPVKEKLRIIPQKTVSGISINLYPSNSLKFSNSMLPKQANVNQTDKQNDRSNSNNSILSPDKNNPNSKDWSVSLNFSAGSYQNITGNKTNSSLIPATPLLTSSNSVDYIKNKYKNEINVPDNADSQYGLPLSAKFMVRKSLGDRWAIESGLSYTYLPTKYKWNKNTVSQHLHYFGIPLNAVYYAVSKPKWNIYASAGGMVEKGVYSIYRNGNLDTNANMKKLQWSVNGTVGATYSLYKNLEIFFEPQFGYFFDNGQPESIRTEWPVSFGLGIGLRFNF